MNDRPKHPVKTTEKSLRIVGALCGHDGRRISELADELGFGKSAVHNHLSTLRDCGYVVKEGDEYRLSLKFLDVGRQTRAQLELYRHGREVVEKLARLDGVSAAELFAREDQCVIPLTSDDESGDRRSGLRTPVTERREGWAILAVDSEASASELARRVASGSDAPESEGAIERREEYIRDVRDRNYGTSPQEGAGRRVVVPISVGGTARGALAVTARQSLDGGEQTVLESADEIEQRIEGSWYDSNRVLNPKHSWNIHSTRLDDPDYDASD